MLPTSHTHTHTHTHTHLPEPCSPSSPHPYPTTGNAVPTASPLKSTGGGVPPMHIQVSLWSPTGEFGAVMEGQLNQDDSVLKVAVKTMKSEYVHTCAPMWEPHPLTSGPSPVPLRR